MGNMLRSNRVFAINLFWPKELGIRINKGKRSLIVHYLSFNHFPILLQRSMWWLWIIFFTLPRMLIKAIELGVAVVVTERGKRVSTKGYK